MLIETIVSLALHGAPVQALPSAFPGMPALPGVSVALPRDPFLPPQDVGCPGCSLGQAGLIDIAPPASWVKATWTSMLATITPGNCTMQDVDEEDPNNPLECLEDDPCSVEEAASIDTPNRLPTHYTVNNDPNTLALITGWPITHTFKATGKCDDKFYQGDSIQLWLWPAMGPLDLAADIVLQIRCRKCDD